MNGNDATLTALTPIKSSSRAASNAPNAAARFDLVLTAVAGLGSPGAPYTLTSAQST